MTENKLEEFDDLDNILESDASGESGGEFSEELDNLLGGEAGAAAGGEEAGDSELDSFFEDLSTIDDLEVLQEEAAPAAAAAAAAAAPKPPPAAAAAAPAEPARPKVRPRKERKASGGGFKRFVVLLVTLGILGGGAFAIYKFLFPQFEMPWPVMQQPPAQPVAKAPPVVAPPPPPPTAPEPLQPRPKPKPEAPYTGPTFGIQVATCYFQSCVDNFTHLMRGKGLDVRSTQRSGSTDMLELISRTAFRDAAAANEFADRINREHRLEGHAFTVKDGEDYRISMGNFSDLTRANVVRDALNQKYGGEIIFATRLVKKPYTLRTLTAGRYHSRTLAEAALSKMRTSDARLQGAFVVKN